MGFSKSQHMSHPIRYHGYERHERFQTTRSKWQYVSEVAFSLSLKVVANLGL